MVCNEPVINYKLVFLTRYAAQNSPLYAYMPIERNYLLIRYNVHYNVH